MAAESSTTDALAAVTSQLPEGGEDRPGQVEMAEAVAKAITAERHLLVQAGTGTGKSLAYLVAAVLGGERTVVVTATKALQDQLAGKDLPFLASHLRPSLDRDLQFAVLKGRSNYLCRQRADEATSDAAQGQLDGVAPANREEIRKLVIWGEQQAAEDGTGDRAELSFEPSDKAWQAVSVTPRECPGANKCPRGTDCFTELARSRAAEADVIVVNTHLYGLDVATEGAVLPEHDVVVIDEAHTLEDTISSTAGREVGAGRVAAVARTAGAVLVDDTHAARIREAGDLLGSALEPERGRRLKGSVPPALTAALIQLGDRLDKAAAAVRAAGSGHKGGTDAKLVRAQTALVALQEDVLAVASPGDGTVRWVEDSPNPNLRLAPIDVGAILQEGLWSQRTAILTSATLPAVLADQVGLLPGTFDHLDVGSPFAYDEQALLYCAAHLPDPRTASFAPAVHEELKALITAAGGRTLALFTSHKAMREAAEALEGDLPGPLLTQTDLPKPALIEAFTNDESSSLFATQGFWQGVDVPGASLSLVTIDKLPFARPDDPLMQARREQARGKAFRLVDLPRASTLLAQGAGRLIRSRSDRGVVAVFDPRLAKAGYRWDVVRALPPMRRTKERSEAEAFLAAIRDGHSGPPTEHAEETLHA
jgi:ATP-dependent DNA helicase DinG